MNRVRRDDVELLLRRQDEVARVVVDDLHARIVDDVVVLLREVRRHDFGNQRLDLADHDALDARMQHERSRRHAGAEADDQHRLRIVVEQRRDVAEHALQSHVLRLARRLDLAGDVEVAHAVRPSPIRRSTSSSPRRRRDTSAPSCTSGGSGRTRPGRRESSAPRARASPPQRARRPARSTRMRQHRAGSLAVRRPDRRCSPDGATRTPRRADTIAIAISMRSACCVPNTGIATTLNSDRPDDRAHRVRRVHAARRRGPRPVRVRPRPRSPAGSSRPRGTPPGTPPCSERIRSIWNVIHGLRDSVGLIGQKGSESAIIHAAHATPAATQQLRPAQRHARLASRAP